jgi:hypothetical protein
MNSTVLTFFYGGLINQRMLDRLGVNPAHREKAVLSGYELTISPYVNLRREPFGTVFGQIMSVSHDELTKIYQQLKVKYLPQAVSVADSNGQQVAALCYMAPHMDPGIAEYDHVWMLLDAALQNGFPAWYLELIRSFMPPQEAK